MTPSQRTRATRIAQDLQLLETELILNQIVADFNIQPAVLETLLVFAKDRWAEPSTRRGLVLLLASILSQYLPQDIAQELTQVALGLVGAQAMVTKG